jgi:hypothetical protein
MRPPKGLNGATDVRNGILDRCVFKLDIERGSSGLGLVEVMLKRVSGTHQKRRARDARFNFLEHLKPFTGDPSLERHKTRNIAARPRHACYKTCIDRIGDLNEYDRNRGALMLKRSC